MERLISREISPSKTGLLLLVVLTLFAIVAIHTYHFSGRNYRQDEAWVAHHALVSIARDGFIQHILGVFRELVPENLVFDIWVALFGHVEPITRFLSTLYTLLGLSFLYRLAKDLFDWQVGLLAVFLLGSLAFYQHYSHEARPYAALATGGIAFMFFFARYLRLRELRYGLWMVAIAGVTLYQHSFMLHVVAAHIILFILFVRWDPRFYRDTLLLFAAIGLIYLPRYLAIANAVNYLGGIAYSMPTDMESLKILYDQMQTRPEPLGYFLLSAGLLLPVRKLFPHRKPDTLRLNREWRKWYLFLLPVLILMIAFGLNLVVQNVTPRNLIIILPPLAILMAFAVRGFPWQARVILVIIMAIPFLTNFRSIISNGGYREITAFLNQHFDPQQDRIVVSAAQVWEHAPIIYYLQERLPFNLKNEDLIHITHLDPQHFATIPSPPVNTLTDAATQSMERFAALINQTETIWLIEGAPPEFENQYLNFIKSRYVPYRSMVAEGETYYYPIQVTEYRRIPDDLQTARAFFDDVLLQSWKLFDSVEAQPCQRITVETWWALQNPVDINYNMTLTLADATGQGVAQNDGAPGDKLMKLWDRGELVVDERALTIPCETADGRYDLLLGIYDPLTGNADELFYLTTLFVQQ